MDQDLQLENCMENCREITGDMETNCSQKTNSGDLETDKLFGEIEELEDEVETRYNRFKNFDVIDRPPHDHHYLTNTQSNRSKKKEDSSPTFRQRIEHERSVLAKNIPSSIFIRSYEERIDLMRAAIVGPPDTSYHQCLFFFDVKFPKNYPSNPPKIHYRSHGIDMNPNLRVDGRVTLPLLETRYPHACLKQNWIGSSNNNTDKWNPEESNMLHILHAIQTILISKPQPLETSYFPFSSKPEPLAKHNKKIFVLACQKMIRVLKEPPVDFNDFVPGHFRKRAHSVLMKFRGNEYGDHCEVMVDLFVRMFKVFERNGTYCKHHLWFLRSINQQNVRGDLGARIRDLEGHIVGTEYKVNFDSVTLVGRENCNIYYCN